VAESIGKLHRRRDAEWEKISAEFIIAVINLLQNESHKRDIINPKFMQ
jgi:hypothetical protein